MFPTVPLTALTVVASIIVASRRRTSGPTFPLLLALACAFLSRIRWEIGGSTVRLEQIALLFLFADTFRRVLLGRIKVEIPLPAALLAALFPVMLLSSALGSPDPMFSLRKSLVYLPYALGLLAVAIEIAGARFVPAWDAFWNFGASAVGLSVAAFLLFYAGWDLGMVRYELGFLSLRGTMINPNLFGSASALTLIVLLHRIVNRPGRAGLGRRLEGAAVAFAAAGTVFSGTRAAWIIAAAGALAALAWGFLARRRRELVRGTAFTAAGTLAALLFLAVRLPVRSTLKPGVSWGEFGIAAEDIFWKSGRFTKTKLAARATSPGAKAPEHTDEDIHRLLKSFSLGHRLKAASAALADWKKSPVLGRGTDSMSLLAESSIRSYIPVAAAQVLHDWGLLGLGLYFSALGLMAASLFRTALSSRAPPLRDAAWSLFLVLLLSTLAYQVTSALVVSICWILWAFCAAGVAFLRGSTAGGE